MRMGAGVIRNITKSGFLRSVSVRVLSILAVVVVVIATVAFTSFTGEVRRNVLSARQQQLVAVESAISKRMSEVSSIAYQIGRDSAFLFEPVNRGAAERHEMAGMLARYRAGNSFIEHLAYCRTSEPDTIYISSGERSLSEFFTTSFGMDRETANTIIDLIQRETQTRIATYGSGEGAYFAYVYPLPQLSDDPQAHVLVMIPVRNVTPLFGMLLESPHSLAAVFDAQGNEIYRLGDTSVELSLAAYCRDGQDEAERTSEDGVRYVMQKVTSPSNGWVYVTAIRRSDTLSAPANQQLGVLLLMLVLLVGAIVAILASVARQYRPISQLAAQVAQDARPEAVDERVLLSDAIASLRDDSAQKQKFQTAYYEAEAASKAKSAFLSSMSHDIRTPMNAIIGLTAIALKHTDDPAAVRECLEKTQVSSRYLLDIINNVLDMSRIESGRIPLAEEPLYLPALVDGVVALISPSAEAKKQTLRVEMDAEARAAVMGDGVRLTQVFVNILSNAVKFTPEGGKLRLAVRRTEAAEPGVYAFAFSDTGIGMSPEFVSHVFETFSRADGMDAAGTEGTGLGMAIAQKLTDMMGGTIACESELGRGTTFTVTLPLRAAGEAEARALREAYERARASGGDADQSAVDLHGRRILLVEDNEVNRLIANKVIGETGAEVVEARDGKEAVAVFADRPERYFDLILMDLQMPVMNGYQATAAIRALARADAATVPIYAMTANTFEEDVRRVRDAGMDGHIGKPYTPQTLCRVLGQALAAR